MKIKKYRTALQNNIRFLKNNCRKSSNVSEWLLDNIHLLEQGGQNACEFFKNQKPLLNSEKMQKIYSICSEAILSENLEESLITLLSAQPDWLDSAELSAIPSTIVFCSVESAVKAVKTNDENLMACSVKALFSLRELDGENLITRFSASDRRIHPHDSRN